MRRISRGKIVDRLLIAVLLVRSIQQSRTDTNASDSIIYQTCIFCKNLFYGLHSSSPARFAVAAAVSANNAEAEMILQLLCQMPVIGGGCSGTDVEMEEAANVPADSYQFLSGGRSRPLSCKLLWHNEKTIAPGVVPATKAATDVRCELDFSSSADNHPDANAGRPLDLHPAKGNACTDQQLCSAAMRFCKKLQNSNLYCWRSDISAGWAGLQQAVGEHRAFLSTEDYYRGLQYGSCNMAFDQSWAV